jgi:hypothetical protein
MNGLSEYYGDCSPDEARRFKDELPCTDRSLKGPVKEAYRQQNLVAQGNTIIGFRGWSSLAADPDLAGWVTYVYFRQIITVGLSLKPGEHLGYIASVRLGYAWLGSGYGIETRQPNSGHHRIDSLLKLQVGSGMACIRCLTWCRLV